MTVGSISEKEIVDGPLVHCAHRLLERYARCGGPTRYRWACAAYYRHHRLLLKGLGTLLYEDRANSSNVFRLYDRGCTYYPVRRCHPFAPGLYVTVTYLRADMIPLGLHRAAA